MFSVILENSDPEWISKHHKSKHKDIECIQGVIKKFVGCINSEFQSAQGTLMKMNISETSCR